MISTAVLRRHLETMQRLGHRVRLPAARERDPAPALLGSGLQAVEGERRPLLKETREEQGLLGDARARHGGRDRARRTRRRRQGDRALQRHRRPTSARTSPITCGSSACWAATSAIAASFAIPTSTTCWISAEHGEPEHPHFGDAQAIYNVIDSRQADPQDTVDRGAARCWATPTRPSTTRTSPTRWWRSPRAARMTWATTLSEEDRGSAYIEVSGRKGFGVKADDLIDRLIAAAKTEVDSRHPEFDARQSARDIATQIAIGALRYFMLKFTSNSVIAFDFKDALSFRRRDRPLRAVRGCARAQHLPQRRHRPRKRRCAPLTARSWRIPRRRSGHDIWELWLTASQDVARHRAVHRDHRAGLPGEACLPAGAAVQQLLSPPPHPDEADEERKQFLLATAAVVRRELIRVLG